MPLACVHAVAVYRTTWLDSVLSVLCRAVGAAAGHIIESRKQMANVTKVSGVTFTVHDLRRTFITIAEGLDISAYALKRLMNHKMNNDVTAGYIMTDVERLRKPMQQISNYMLKCMGVVQSADVIALKRTDHTPSL